ncbi:MAG: DUF3592 domain-containing protein [Cyanobacteria bacterium HKST-UBA02]|nr:DUF3592 domain-containing protein [Cyanobacteria bacterium HKST-UBA02]
MSTDTSDLRRERIFGILIVAAIAFGVSLVCAHMAWLQYQSLAWVRAQATVVSAEYKDLEHSKHLKLKYEYVVDKKKFACVVEQDVIERDYKPGDTLPITYDPGNPATSSYVDDQAGPFMILYSAFSIGLFMVGTFLVLWAREN